MKLFEKAREVELNFSKLEEKLSKAYADGNAELIRDLSKERSMYEDTVQTASEYLKIANQFKEVTEMLENKDADSELLEMALEEKKLLEEKINEIEPVFLKALLPKDPRDSKNVIIEIRAGTGGEEAALFAGDLFRMYTKYAERSGFNLDMISIHKTELGGYKEIIFSIEGKGAFSKLKFEGGVHRVQRVPRTEASGRIHTSAATVVVLAEPDEVDIELDMNELRIDVFRSQGPGGQSVNTTDSAVRITHLPSGLVVSCQDEKSQLKNKNKALRVLKARLMELEEKKKKKEMESARRSMIGSGDRSERIRTYNFPQNRVTDHRIELTIYALTEILDGDLEKVIEPLQIADQNARLEGMEGLKIS